MYRAVWTCDRCGRAEGPAYEDDPKPAPAGWRVFEGEMPHRTAGWAHNQALCPTCVASLEFWMRREGPL